jgi:hypothetical protein
VIKVSGTRGKAVSFHSELLKNRNIKIAQRTTIPAIPLETVMLAILESTASQHDGQISTRVGTGVTHPAAKHHHRGVKERSTFSILGILKTI